LANNNEKCTGIVPDDSQHTTYIDVGSAGNAGNAGAVFCHSIHEDTLKSFFGNCSCIALLSDIHVTTTIFSIRSIHGSKK